MNIRHNIKHVDFPLMLASQMMVGQIGIAEKSTGSIVKDDYVMMIHANRLVSLSSPHNTWSPADCLSVKVRIVSPGTILSLEVGG